MFDTNFILFIFILSYPIYALTKTMDSVLFLLVKASVSGKYIHDLVPGLFMPKDYLTIRISAIVYNGHKEHE